MSDWLQKTLRCEAYRRYLNEQRCRACMAYPPNPAHHLDSGATGMKLSVFVRVTCCDTCHGIIHQKGLAYLEEKEQVNMWRQAHKQLREYPPIRRRLEEISDNVQA